MKSMTGISRLLDIPPSTSPDDARRRKLLNILLTGIVIMVIVGLLATTIVSITGGTVEPGVGPLYGGGVALLFTIVVIFVVNRYWSGWIASSLFLLILTITFVFADTPRQVVEGRSTFLFTIPILMASVALRPWASFAAAALSSSVVAILMVTKVGGVPPIPTMLGFFAVALVSWLSARSLENALQDLRALNRELDQRVDERTRELSYANRQLARANERLMELDRLKSRFVSMVSHELRTPLGAVQGFAEMLLAGIYGSLSAKQKDALERIESNTRTLLNIVNDLLDQARIEAGQLSLHPAPFRPTELADNLQSTMGVLAKKEGLELTTSVAPGLPETIYGDKERLNQILLNLVNNAIKFTEKGGIEVRMYLPDGSNPSHWAIEVVDSGPGIPEKDHASIFVPFGRVDDSMTRRHKGVGLGLSIVKQLAELMGGDITLESEIGDGSTFTVHLPLKQ
jgi:signal transduction histidine kinase